MEHGKTNPCKRCLVTTMCREPCDDLIDHLDINGCEHAMLLISINEIKLELEREVVKLVRAGSEWKWLYDF